MRLSCAVLLGLAAAACGGGDDDEGDGGGAALVLTSSAIDDGGAFPIDHTCEGDNSSPPLAWSGGPDGAAGYGLVLIDESNGLIHWVMWDIPADVSSLPEGIEKTAEPDEPSGAKQSQAFDGATRGWLGPCPPETHEYLIRLYAQDEHPLSGVTLDTGRAELVAALESSALADADLRAAYQPQN